MTSEIMKKVSEKVDVILIPITSGHKTFRSLDELSENRFNDGCLLYNNIGNFIIRTCEKFPAEHQVNL